MRTKYLNRKFSQWLVVLIISGLVLSGQFISGNNKAEAAVPNCSPPNTKSLWGLDVNNKLGKISKNSFTAQYGKSIGPNIRLLNNTYQFKSLKNGVTDLTHITVSSFGDGRYYHIARCSVPMRILSGSNSIIVSASKGLLKTSDGKFEVGDASGESSRQYTYYIYLRVHDSRNNKDALIGPYSVDYKPPAEVEKKNQAILNHINDAGECSGSLAKQKGCRKLDFIVGISGEDITKGSTRICRITIYQFKAGVIPKDDATKLDSSNWASKQLFTSKGEGGSRDLTKIDTLDKCHYERVNGVYGIEQKMDFILHSDDKTSPKNANYYFAGVEYQAAGERATTHFADSSDARSFVANFAGNGNVTGGTWNPEEPNPGDSWEKPPSGNDPDKDDECPLNNKSSNVLYRTFVGTPACGVISLLINGATGIAGYFINSLFVPSLGIQYESKS